MNYYSIPALEILSFQDTKSKKDNPNLCLIGFYLLSEDIRQQTQADLLHILNSRKEEELVKLPDILKKLIYSIAIADGQNSMLVAKQDKLSQILEDEEYLLMLLPNVIIFLQKAAKLGEQQAILDANLEQFLLYAVEKQKQKPSLLKQEAFKALVKPDPGTKAVNIDDSTLDPAVLLSLDFDEEEDVTLERSFSQPLDDELFLRLSYKDVSWEYLFLKGEQFPLFKENLRSLEMHKTMLNFSSEFGLAESIALECWKRYRPEQDLIAFLQHTAMCQSLLRTIREKHT